MCIRDRNYASLDSYTRNPFITQGTVTGTRSLGPNGGSVTLVTPVTFRNSNVVPTGQRAGYAVLEFTFLPEATIGSLALSAAAVALVVYGRRARG